MKILIANRGEVARRINRTIQKIGFQSLQPYVEGDLDAFLGEFTFTEKIQDERFYLSINQILKLAEKHQVAAIHPGYGYLSESAEFAAAVLKKGMIFIGPTTDTLMLAGKKDLAKKLAKKLNIPILKSVPVDRKTDLAALTQKLKFPIILKAVSGGGGRGMRKCSNLTELKQGIETCEKEGTQFFNNGALIAEIFLEDPRHIEVQILGLKTGEILNFGTRDCSIQRRFQKVIEIAPARDLQKEQLDQLINYAEALGKEFQLLGLATVEFLIKDKAIFFIEINPRLQVEHTITEEIYDIDLVELQILAVLGRLKSFTPKYNKKYSVELRICAEDEEYNPTIGEIINLDLNFSAISDKIRVEHSLFNSKVITTQFDSMIAKVIVTDKTELETYKILDEVVKKPFFWGLKTNLNFLHNQITNKKSKKLNPELISKIYLLLSQGQFFRVASSKNLVFSGYLKINAQIESYQVNYEEIIKEDFIINQNYIIIEGQKIYFYFQAVILNLYFEGLLYQIEQSHPKIENTTELNFLIAPLPGKIAELNCANLDRVSKNMLLLKLESMKTIFELNAPRAGIVSKLVLNVGDFIQAGERILELI